MFSLLDYIEKGGIQPLVLYNLLIYKAHLTVLYYQDKNHSVYKYHQIYMAHPLG